MDVNFLGNSDSELGNLFIQPFAVHILQDTLMNLIQLNSFILSIYHAHFYLEY